MKISVDSYWYDDVKAEGYIGMFTTGTQKNFLIEITTNAYNSVEKHFSGRFEVQFWEVKGTDVSLSYVKYDPVLFRDIYNIAKGVGHKMMRNKPQNVATKVN